MMYSKLVNDCASTLRMACSRYSAVLYTGVTTLTSGGLFPTRFPALQQTQAHSHIEVLFSVRSRSEQQADGQTLGRAVKGVLSFRKRSSSEVHLPCPPG